MRLRSIRSYFAVCAVTLGTMVLTCAAPNAWAQSPAAGGAAKPPYNIIFVISDQEADHLLATGDFELPARAELRRRGFDFRNHYTAAAMCTPSRAAFISGTPPQVNGVFDQMETGYVPSLRTDRPNMGSVLKGLVRDNDRGLRLLVDAMDELDLWKNTVVVVSADHGEMAGSHGGLRGKGPFAYELNSHIPLLIAHPGHAGGKKVTALTSHLDLLPTFVGMTGLPEARRQAVAIARPEAPRSQQAGIPVLCVRW